jgi:hypothetical protein
MVWRLVTQESTMQAIDATRPGGHMGYVGVKYEVKIPGIDLFFAGIHVHGGPAPVRRFLPDLVRQIWDREIDPGKVLDLTLPLGSGRRGLQGDGRAHRHQGVADAGGQSTASETEAMNEGTTSQPTAPTKRPANAGLL